MRFQTLQITSALCLSLALVQPPQAAFAKPDCRPGTKDCQAQAHHGKRKPRRAEPSHHNGPPSPVQQAAPLPRRAEPSHHNGPPSPVQQAAPQPRRAEPSHHNGPPSPVQQAAPQPRRAEPSHHNGPPSPVQQAAPQPRRAEPSHHNGPPSPVQQAAPLNQQDLQRYARHDRIATGPNTREVLLRRSDVPQSRNYDYRRHHDRAGNGSDFAQFGLALLAGVTVGQMLSGGDRVVDTYGSRVVYQRPGGGYGLYHDPNVLLRRPGATVTTERYSDGSVLTRVVQPDGTVITTLTDPYGRILRRRFDRPGGHGYTIVDDTRASFAPVPHSLPPQSPVDVLMTPQTGPQILLRALEARPLQPVDRAFPLNQVLDTPGLRYMVPEVEVGTLSFPSGSAAIPRDQAQALQPLAKAMTEMIAKDPTEVFLIEGHTDTVGNPAQNLALSDARAESAALALTEYYGVPPQNLVTQGYGENDLKQQVQGPDPANRRLVVRRITDLLPQG